MRCSVTLKSDGDGVVASCEEYPGLSGRGLSAASALEALRSSVLFHEETCPCDLTAGPGLELHVTRDER